MRASRGRNEGADLGQKHDQGGLPENGGFPGHVRAGYDEHLLAFLVEFQIVWDKAALGQKPLYNRMSSIPDMDGIVPDRPRVCSNRISRQPPPES